MRLLGFVVALTLLPFVGAGRAHAAFVVNSTDDTVDANPGNGVCADASGACTLRAAIMEANALVGADTITLPAGTYTLTIPGIDENVAASGDLDITDDVTISGAGAATTIIDGAGLDRVLHIVAGAVALSSVTIRGGHSVPGDGGGIYNAGTLTLDSSSVSDNAAARNGGGGGGIYNAGTLTIVNSSVRGNRVDGISYNNTNGGGIYNAGTLILNNSSVSGNRADGTGNGNASGGGIYNRGTLTLTNTAVSGNTSAIEGGGIYNNGGAVTLNGSTVSGNTSVGIYTVGTLTLNSSTVSGNTEAGVWNFGTGTIKNTIVANNAGEDCSLSGTFTSLGHNLDSDGTCNLTEPGDLPNRQNPLLGPLADNGGPTQTHALLTGSPAIDAGSADCPPPLTDQRGVARPQGAACDIGAYEVECTTGGQSVDLTVPSSAAVLGVGTGTPVTVGSPLTVNYSVQGCFGKEMFLIAVVNAPPIVLSPSYYDGSTWVPVPTPLSLMTPSLTGGPGTSDGTHTLFSGGLPPGTYDLFLVCDLFVNGRLDVPAPSCLSGAFDHLPLTVQ